MKTNKNVKKENKKKIEQVITKLDGCPDCHGTGVIETGNNDIPCDCPLGDAAVFNTVGMGQVTGFEWRRKMLDED